MTRKKVPCEARLLLVAVDGLVGSLFVLAFWLWDAVVHLRIEDELLGSAGLLRKCLCADSDEDVRWVTPGLLVDRFDNSLQISIDWGLGIFPQKKRDILVDHGG